MCASLRRGCHLERRASLQKKKSRRFFCSAGVDLSRRGYAARAAAMSEPRACPDGARSGGLTRRAAELRPATAASSMIERSSLRHPLDAFCCIILRALALTAPPHPFVLLLYIPVGGRGPGAVFTALSLGPARHSRAFWPKGRGPLVIYECFCGFDCCASLVLPRNATHTMVGPAGPRRGPLSPQSGPTVCFGANVRLLRTAVA